MDIDTEKLAAKLYDPELWRPAIGAARKAADAIAEAAQQTAAAATQAIKDFAAAIMPIWEEYSIWTEAERWAKRERPKWLNIYNRTKKRRVRKKYSDKIMRAYLQELGLEP